MNKTLILQNAFRRITALSIFLAVCMAPVQAASADLAVFYVAPTSQGTGDCSSWANACGLVSALDEVSSGVEIWVRAGLYKPTGNPTARSASFSLVDGVAVYGGFAGDETSREQRSWRLNHTILSGDIDGDDTNTDGNFIAETVSDLHGANSYHVVANNGNELTAILDGFIITAGNSLGVNYGGGVFNWQASPTLVNLIIIGNLAISGAGMMNQQSSAVLTNIAFIENAATQRGGGLQNSYQCNPVLTNVAFIRNSATLGGGLENETSNQTLMNVSFRANHSYENGAGLYELSSTSSLVNVTFYGNNASGSGGGIYVNNSSTTLQNAVLWGDQAGGSGAEIYNNGDVSVAYSDVQGCGGSSAWNAVCGTNSGGNIDLDPLFVNAPNGNLRLQLTSPAVDAGDNSALPLAVTFDLGGNPRYVDISTKTDTGNGTPPIIDMGAFEAYHDPVPPEVISITRLDPSPNFESSVDFLVTFSEAVEGIDAIDFFLSASGDLAPQPITIIMDAGDHIHYIVTVDTGTGSGTLRLNVHANPDIEDLAGNALTGLAFTDGETYVIRIAELFLPVVIR